MWGRNKTRSFSSSVGRAQDWKSWGRWFKSSLKHLNVNYKLYFKCVLDKLNFSFVNNSHQSEKNYNIIVQPSSIYYLTMHLRLSTLFYSTQLVDIFSYEIPSSNFNLEQEVLSTADSSLLVYNYHSLITQDRFFIFVNCGSSYGVSTSSRSTVQSISELFSAANWLEREVSELSGVSLSGKKDLRNLMLQYGDASTPFKKSFPTIVLREMFYNPVKDTIVQNPVTMQL